MPDQSKIDAALAELDSLSGPELQAAIHARKNRKLHDAEAAKAHPLTAFTLPANGWGALKEHILDGGGVEDDRELSKALLQSLVDDDQAAFWPSVIHLIKARAKIKGHMRALPHGGVSLSGIGAVKAGSRK